MMALVRDCALKPAEGHAFLTLSNQQVASFSSAGCAANTRGELKLDSADLDSGRAKYRRSTTKYCFLTGKERRARFPFFFTCQYYWDSVFSSVLPAT